MNLWSILGYGFLGAACGTITGVLLSTNRKMYGMIMFVTGSVIGWSLVGVNILTLIHSIMTHAFVWRHWHHAVSLNGLAFKVADGASTAASFASVVIARRVMSGKGFPMNRLVVAGILVTLGLVVLVDTVTGQLPWAIALLIGMPAWIVAVQLPTRSDRRRMARWIIRNERAQRKFIRENPDLAAHQLTRAYQPWP